MQINKCRVCSRDFFSKPILQYSNMPAAAQNFPDADNLQKDHGIDLDIWQCSGCGLVQISNEPVPYYKQVIRASSISEEMKDFRIKQFTEFLKKYSLTGKKVVEIGCGRGEYLSLMKQSGALTYGIEDSQESVVFCKKSGLNVTKGYIEKPDDKIKNTPFDAFFILNFLEHFPNPNSALKGICNNLTDDGIGMVEVPNFDMILRKKIFSEFITDHLFYFTKDTLRSTLTINGFEVIECNELFHDYIISAIVRKRKQLDISVFYKYQTKIKNGLEKYINRFGKNKTAVWGAGHQALAIISLTNLSNKVKYVIDSAIFKQGKYTPGTHIPIVSPDSLNNDPVDAIIVITGGYSNEVAKIIKQKFNKKIKIAILRDYGLEEVN